jgi:muramoyltetrapeptide carboxypeptidase
VSGRTRLAPGARVAVVAPSHAFDEGKLARGMAIARERGIVLDPFPDLLRPHRYLAADDGHRLAQLRAALASPDHDAVWMVRGGSGMGRLLADLDPAALRPKWVVGFSDVTSLLCRLHGPPGWSLVHGPVLHSLPETDAPSTDALFALLAGEPPEAWSGETWLDGVAEGPVAGGNLTVLASTCGTPWQPDLRGHVLLLEEIGEAPYRIDRCLRQLLDAGVLDGVVGMGVGQHVSCAPPPGAAWNLRDVYAEACAPLGIPLVGELPFGHGAVNRAFRWGDRVILGTGGLRFHPA